MKDEKKISDILTRTYPKTVSMQTKRRRWIVHLHRGLRWIGSHELSTLLAALLLAGGVWAFAELADEVTEGSTRSVDRAILLTLRSSDDHSDPLGPRFVEELGRDFTALGGMGVLIIVSLATVTYLALLGKPQTGLFVIAAVAGALVISMTLKLAFDRPRPDLVPHGSHVYTASFPSGHAMTSAATYLALGGLLARAHRRKRLKAFFLLLAIMLTLFVGISRVYLGVHWPTDVLAGWALGTCWAIACWLAAKWMQHRGHVEPEVSSE